MYIIAKEIPASLKVNKIGKYLYNHIDGAFKFKLSSNACDVYFTLLYQSINIPNDDVHEITINLSVTTYQNKIRVNIIEVTPKSRTLGYNLYSPEILEDLESAKRLIMKDVIRRMSKVYREYEFIF